MNELIYLVGLPGSGKSTVANEYTRLGYEIFSSDSIREELYGSASVQEEPNKVFTVLHKRIKEALKEGKDCVYDATNVIAKRRIAFLNEIKNINARKTCIIVWSSIDTCKERNRLRDRVVPDEVIDRMYKQFTTPYYFEGWDNIEILITEDRKDVRKTLDELVTSSYKFNQENHHHKYSLGDHCYNTWLYIRNNTPSVDRTLETAAVYHDIGKLKTKAYSDAKGNPTPEAHYYNHQNVGAYDIMALAYKSTNKAQLQRILYISTLICYHMHPYFWKNNDKMLEKYKKLFGAKLYSDICKLHIADVSSH